MSQIEKIWTRSYAKYMVFDLRDIPHSPMDRRFYNKAEERAIIYNTLKVKNKCKDIHAPGKLFSDLLVCSSQLLRHELWEAANLCSVTTQGLFTTGMQAGHRTAQPATPLTGLRV